MKCDVSKEKWMLLRGSYVQNLVSIKLFTWNIITIIGIQDKNTKNSIKSKNYHKSKTLKELKKLYIDWLVYCYKAKCTVQWVEPGDFRSWESPQTLPALFIGPFEHVERFRNLKCLVKRITHIQSTVLSSSEGTAAIHLAFK